MFAIPWRPPTAATTASKRAIFRPFICRTLRDYFHDDQRITKARKCPPAASRRLGLPKSHQTVSLCATPTVSNLRMSMKANPVAAPHPSCSQGRSAKDRGEFRKAAGGCCGRPFIRSCGTRRRDEAPESRYVHFVGGDTDMVVAIG